MILMLLLVIGKFPPRVFQRLTKVNVIAPPGYLCFVFFSCFRPELHPHLSPLPRPSPLYPVLYISSLTLLCQAPYRFTLPAPLLTRDQITQIENHLNAILPCSLFQNNRESCVEIFERIPIERNPPRPTDLEIHYKGYVGKIK